MKKILIFTLFATTIISCRNKADRTTYCYLKVQNNTAYQVKMGLFKNEDTSFLKEYTIEPFEKTDIIDTATFLTYFDNGEDVEYISGSGFNGGVAPYWDADYLSSFAYDFEGIKRSILQETRVSECDTNSTVSLCNFGIKEIYGNQIDKKNTESFQTVTYVITNQQFLLADSL